MNTQTILEELVMLLEALGVITRNVPVGGSGGGLCSLKGERIFFLDTEAPSAVTAALCAEALSQVMDIEQIYIKPEIREFIESHSRIEKE
jgi:hypothetical protein